MDTTLQENKVLEGKVLEKKKKKVFVDLSPFGVGVIRGVNYLEAKNELKDIEEGDNIKVRVLEIDNENGFIELALQATLKEASWLKIKELKEKDEKFPILILDANTGGLLGKIDNLTGFLPTSQMSSEHYPKVEDNDKEKILARLKELIGQELMVKVLDFDSSTNKLIFSEKLIELDQAKETLRQFKEGDIVEVIVTRIVDFGVFVKFKNQNIDGLIHISEIPNEKGQKIDEILKEGEEIKAKIVKIQGSRVFLSLKNLKASDSTKLEKEDLKND